MKKEIFNPKTLFSGMDYGYSQVIATEGGKWVHVSGQTAWDTKKNLVGKGDLRLQARAAMSNVRLALEAAGAALPDIVRMRLYVVDFKEEHLPIIEEEIRALLPSQSPPVSTLIGVSALAQKDYLIEIEVTAVMEESP